ncbi:MAG: GumC family protein [Bacteroidota bacterium]|jgi:tyrosine-protein kinase Etk/Wzc
MEKKMGANNLIDSKDIKKGLSTVSKNWYLFAIFIGLGIIIGSVYLYNATKFYGATTELLIKPQKDPFKDALSESLPSAPRKEEIANEVKIIKSTKLIDETINKLNLDIGYYIEGRIKTGEVYKGTPFTVVGKLTDKSLYNVPFEIKILNQQAFIVEINTDGYKFKRQSKFGVPVINEKFSFIVNSDSTIINRNTKISDIPYIFKFKNHDDLVKKYQRALTIEKDQTATVIKISLEDEVEDKAIDFLNTLISNYIENSVEVQKTVNENTVRFIDAQLADVENQLNNVESNLESFQKSRTTLNLGEESGMLFQRVVDFDSEKARMNIQLKSVDMMYDYLTNSTGENMAISPSVLAEANDPGLQGAFDELYALQQKRSNLLFSNTENSKSVVENDQMISRSKQKISGIVLNIRKNLVNKINSISGQIGSYNSALRQMPSTQRGIVNINRNVEIYSEIYKFLLETRAQTIIAKASIVADKIVLESAYGNGLLHPLPVMTLATGIGGGLALALLIIFFKGIYYNYVFSKEDIKEVTDLPIIGVIGKSKEAEDEYLMVDKFPQSQIAEAFRVIRTNLSYFASKSKNKVILITSTMPGEGKTFTAVNIATILTRAKKKVVLLDLDLHKPKQANAFDLQNDFGVTSYIVGKANLKQITKDSGIDDLKIILSGPRTPNASELILDENLDKLINDLKEVYDYVIIDTPPIGLLSDALVLMKQSDVNIFVMKAGVSKKEFIDIAHQLVEKNEIKHMSIVLNGVSSKNIPSGYGAGYYS